MHAASGRQTTAIREATLADDEAELRSVGEVEPILSAWRALSERVLEPNLFAEPGWLVPALQHLAEARPTKLLCLWRGEGADRRLVALTPVVVRHRPLAAPALEIWRPTLALSGTPLIDRAEPDRALAGLFSACDGPAAWTLPRIAADGPFAAALARVAAGQGRCLRVTATAERPVLRAMRPDGVEHLTDHRLLRTLQGEPARGGRAKLRIERARDPAAVRDAVEEFLVIDANAAGAVDRPALIQDPGTASFVRTMTRLLARERKARVDLLRHDGRAVAAAIVLRSGSRAWLWRSAVEPDQAAPPASAAARLAVEITRAQREQARITRTEAGDTLDVSRLWTDWVSVVDYRVELRSRASTRRSGPSAPWRPARPVDRLASFVARAWRDPSRAA